jgi:hypothetical protein|tara:strand:+ start:932 stop:1606 length:675 start_codon:yes stop_codon:yes gene_type:complete
MPKYNIYIICKTEEDFLTNSQELMNKYKSKICHVQWVPAEYLKLTQCNKKILKDLNTRWNTESKKVLAKLGTIAAHRKALLAIYMNKTDNNIILESDATLSAALPTPPAVSCYLGGWIIPPQITKAGIVKLNVHPKKGLNEIKYGTFSVLMAHAYFIKTFEESMNLFQTTITDKIKNYDIHLIDMQFLNKYYYPPIFVQGKHVSEIDKITNKNDLRTHLYGLKM